MNVAVKTLLNGKIDKLSIFSYLPQNSRHLQSLACSKLIFFDNNCENNQQQPRLHNVLLETRRYFPKPVKNVQYKYDFRIFENKTYTVDPIQVPRMHGLHPETNIRHNVRVKGGVPFDFFWITAYPRRPPEGSFFEERVLEVRCDPNRTAFIAQLAGVHGRRWTLAADEWQAGDIIRTINRIPEIAITPNKKEIWPVGAVVDGTQVCMVEAVLGARTTEELRSIAAGSSSTVVGRRGDNVLIKLPNQHEVLIDKNCFATIGRISNPEWGSQQWGSMNMKRRMGIKQGSGLWQRKDGYCGRKIKPLPAPLIPERRGPPPPRYNFTIDVKDYNCGFGTNEYNPVMKGG